MIKSLLSLCFFIASATAKGRGGGRGGGSIDDNWDVPGTVKATMAFQIIWFIFILGLFVGILRRRALVPAGRYTRAPYILLAVLAGLMSLGYLLAAIYLRISRDYSRVIDYKPLHGFGTFVNILFNVSSSFLFGVSLWLTHLRGNLVRVNQEKNSKPWVSQFWKRTVDWSLVAIIFLLSLSYTSVLANLWTLSDADRLSNIGYYNYIKAMDGLNYTSLAFYLLASIDIVVSFIALKVSQKRVNFVDPISTRLLTWVLPFVCISAIADLVLTIYPKTQSILTLDYNALDLAGVIIIGVCRIGIISGLMSTMSIPNAQWAPGAFNPNSGLTYVPQQPQQPQQSFYQPPWQNSPSMPTPGQYPHPGQFQAPSNPPPGHQPYTIPNNP